MNKDNLCMVFAPSFLRCPYTDTNKIFAATEKEKEFLLALWEIVPALPITHISKVPNNLIFEREEFYIAYYSENFAQEGGNVLIFQKLRANFRSYKFFGKGCSRTSNNCLCWQFIWS
jgi:hypothetical protein